MIVNDLNIQRARIGPTEADPEPLVDAHAVLTPPISGEGLEPITRGDPEIVQSLGRVELI